MGEIIFPTYIKKATPRSSFFYIISLIFRLVLILVNFIFATIMPQNKKTSQSAANKKVNIQSENPTTNKERLQFIAGIVFVFLGIFISLSIFSYFSTWKIDQSAIYSSSSIFNFIFSNNDVIANLCGRLGAAIAHVLVHQGVGVIAILFSIWLIGIGVNWLYDKVIFPSKKWIRWMSLGCLFFCPLLSFVTMKADFPYGGVLGSSLVAWTNGVAGTPGTILMLIAVLVFYVILVFQWDVKPYLSAIKSFIPERSSIHLSKSENSQSNTLQQDEQMLSKDEYGLAGIQLLDKTETNEVDETNVKPVFEGNTYEEPIIDSVDELSSLQIDDSLQTQETLAPTLDIKMEENATIPLDIIQTIEEQVEDDYKEENIVNKEPISTVDEMHSADQHSLQSVPVIVNKNGITVEFPDVNESTSFNTTPGDVSKSESDIHITPSLKDNPKENSNNNLMDIGIEIIQGKEETLSTHVDGNQSVAHKEDYAPELDLRDYKFPILDLLDNPTVENIALNAEELAKNKDQIINTLKSFGIEIQKIQATVGPTVTLYEIVPQEGVRISKIRNLEDDIALNLAALGIRMIAPIPGRGTIGIEVPNAKKQIVPMRALLASEKFINNEMSLPIALGKKIDNENYIVDLATMPHLLMAGATGQGKSVGINTILVSLLYKKHPSQLKFVLVDPKKVELSVYRTIEKHYLAKLPNEEEAIITDTKKVINTLNSLCIEMDNRYELLKDAGARNIKEYNEKFIKRKLNPEKGHKYLPFIVLVIDEFADLIMTAGKEVEMPVARLAQLARAIGIHLIVATQRPSVNVITGIIKANFPARIAFRVTSKVDSRTILDTGGADQLIGRGDMLVSHGSELLRLQCAFVDTPEVERIVEYIGNQRGYPQAFELPEYEGAEDEGLVKEDIDLSKRDKMFEECARLVVHSQSGSTSMLQRKFNLGYNRAGRIMDQLEAAGIVGGQVGSKPRDVLVNTEYELEEILNNI